MDLAFISEDLRNTCEKDAVARRELGDEVARVLRGRIADLRAATSVRDLVVGKPRCEMGMTKPTIIVDLAKGYELSFCANHVKSRLSEAGEIDWSLITRIKILSVSLTENE